MVALWIQAADQLELCFRQNQPLPERVKVQEHHLSHLFLLVGPQDFEHINDVVCLLRGPRLLVVRNVGHVGRGVGTVSAADFRLHFAEEVEFVCLIELARSLDFFGVATEVNLLQVGNIFTEVAAESGLARLSAYFTVVHFARLGLVNSQIVEILLKLFSLLLQFLVCRDVDTVRVIHLLVLLLLAHLGHSRLLLSRERVL